MKIGPDMAVSIDYTLKNAAGEVIDQSATGEPLTYLHGRGNIVTGLEKALAGRGVGESINVAVQPEEGYGRRNEAMTMRVPRSDMPPDLDPEVGMMLGAEGPNGEHIPMWVKGVDATHVDVDGNHPLAGEVLHFDVTIAAIRAATREELSHGHVHGAGGHHHH